MIVAYCEVVRASQTTLLLNGSGDKTATPIELVDFMKKNTPFQLTPRGAVPLSMLPTYL